MVSQKNRVVQAIIRLVVKHQEFSPTVKSTVQDHFEPNAKSGKQTLYGAQQNETIFNGVVVLCTRFIE